eukprot:jgi/Hompol1/5113/HPOL_004190-RA
MYLTHTQNNEAAKLDRLIDKWKVVCQDIIRDLRAQIGEVIIPRKSQNTQSNPFQDDRFGQSRVSGFGIHPRDALTWNKKFEDLDEDCEMEGNGRAGAQDMRPRKLTLHEVAAMYQFDISMIGHYDPSDDEFVY